MPGKHFPLQCRAFARGFFPPLAQKLYLCTCTYLPTYRSGSQSPRLVYEIQTPRITLVLTCSNASPDISALSKAHALIVMYLTARKRAYPRQIERGNKTIYRTLYTETAPKPPAGEGGEDDISVLRNDIPAPEIPSVLWTFVQVEILLLLSSVCIRYIEGREMFRG